MLRQSMIAAAFAIATVTAAGHSDAAPAGTSTANIPIFAVPAASSNPPSTVAAPRAQHHAPVRYRTVVHHVYRYEAAPAAYYYGPVYAPPPPVAALPAAAACLALSLLGGC
jgi:hypothetical protein